MDTRSRKWTNKVLITLVMIVMTLSGIYGLNMIHNMALTGDNSFSLDEQDQSDYIKHTQMSLFDTVQDNDIIEEIKNLEIGNLTPMEALNILYNLQNKIKNRW